MIKACLYNLIDSCISLNIAFFVNASILIGLLFKKKKVMNLNFFSFNLVSAATFYTRNIEVTRLQDAHQLLKTFMGNDVAAVFFGIGLLCSGQSSTLTGTLAGQIVMEVFLKKLKIQLF